MQKKGRVGNKASQMSAFPLHPKETVRGRYCRERQGKETVPPIVGGQDEAGPNPKKEDLTPELSQEATQKLHH